MCFIRFKPIKNKDDNNNSSTDIVGFGPRSSDLRLMIFTCYANVINTNPQAAVMTHVRSSSVQPWGGYKGWVTLWAAHSPVSCSTTFLSRPIVTISLKMWMFVIHFTAALCFRCCSDTIISIYYSWRLKLLHVHHESLPQICCMVSMCFWICYDLSIIHFGLTSALWNILINS